MSRLDDAIAGARAQGRAALVGYLPAGYPDVPVAIEAMTAMVEAGVDVVEIGLPYSDPLMDGPTIQAAVDAALRGGTTTPDVTGTTYALEMLRDGGFLVLAAWLVLRPLSRLSVDAYVAGPAEPDDWHDDRDVEAETHQ